MTNWWRVSHVSLFNNNKRCFIDRELEYFRQEQIIVVAGEHALKMAKINKGDYFFLVNGNNDSYKIQLIGQITDDDNFVRTEAPRKGWYQRKYKPIKNSPVLHNLPGWENGSITQIRDLEKFSNEILRPYFNMAIDPTTHEPIDLDAPNEPQPVTEPPKKIFPLNQILFGPPGTGKTYLTRAYAVAICDNQKLGDDYDAIKTRYNQLDGRRIKFVTFHQSYGYEDFIEGIKPELVNGNISYEIESGVFKKFCEIAKARPNENFVFIIDEINRGNISKIFGELITLIEDDKRDDIFVTLPYSQQEFTVPKNVYILGTMNTADRSIALLDTALRRRFNFIEMMPRPELLKDNIDGVNLQNLLKELNRRIEMRLDREHTIGHAYFIKCTKLAEIADVFRNKIIPLLQEYFFDDYDQIYSILGEKFFDKTPLDDEKFRYTLNEAALNKAETYKL